MSSAYDDMIAGRAYNGAHPSLMAMQAQARARMAALDEVPPDDIAARAPLLKALFGSMAGPCIVKPPFNVEFGCNIHLGNWVFINNGATFMDSALISIGDRAAIGPNVQLVTPSHPVRPEERFTETDPRATPPFVVHNIARPITIGAYAWLGAGVTVMPGVTIGEGGVVGAGSVVTKDVPARMIVAGNPARIIRSVDA